LEGVVSTPKAAELLGVSRQHMAALADKGVITSWRVGRHRRFHTRDLMLYKMSRVSSGGVTRLESMTVTDLRSWIFGVLVASKLDKDPKATSQIGRTNLAKQKSAHTDGSAQRLLDEWERLLSGPTRELQRVLVSTTQECIELRHVSPFAGVLSESERTWVIESTRRVSEPSCS
jgi:excisionase family DNA binding protein